MTGQPTACAETLEQISAYLDGELGTSACAAIEAHCQTCAPCAAVVDSLRRTVGLCREAGEKPVPDAVRTRARDSIRKLMSRT